MKKIIILFVACIVSIGVLYPQPISAAGTASVYVSPSSSTVTKGSNVTVQVRVNSGTDLMNAVQARINFDSTRLQYVSFSAGDFSTFQNNISSNSFEYVGALFGGATSSDRRMFSVTFKSINSGTANLSLSGVEISNAGSALAITGTPGGSISIQEPVIDDGGSSSPPAPTPTTSPSSGGTSSPTSRQGTSSPQPQQEAAPIAVAPQLVGTPEITSTPGVITIKLKTDIPAKVSYEYNYKNFAGSGETTEKTTEHTVDIGRDTSLVPGAVYKINLTLLGDLDTKSEPIELSQRSTGVDYAVRITDLDGRPLANYPVQLFSDPQDATTDSSGIARFSDVTPGEHTLVFEIDGLVLRLPVLVGNALQLTTEENDQDLEAITLPVRFADSEQSSSASTVSWELLVGGVLLGIVASFVLQLKQSKQLMSNLFARIKRNVNRSKKNETS